MHLPEGAPATDDRFDPEDVGQPRLLLIEDSDLFHRLIRVRLKHESISIHGAYTGAEGLELARAIGPDVIVLDIDLPDTDGYAIIQELKNDPLTRDVPVLFTSCYTEARYKVRAFDLGAVDFIPKPFEVAELRARVRFAMQQHRLIRMLARCAQLDALTGLWNRAYFDQRLSDELESANRYDRSLSLAMLDLDHFKGVNDKYGHPFGDRVLEGAARVLSHLRAGDVACRYGGEEFAVILPSTDLKSATAIADRVRATLGETVWEGNPEFRITASVGIACTDQLETRTPASLLEAADRALYRAKSSGRNQAIGADAQDVREAQNA